MDVRFTYCYLPPAKAFVASQPKAVQDKIAATLARAQQDEDIKWFKALNDTLWEFRVQHLGLHLRLFAFWVPDTDSDPQVVITSGLIKTSKKLPPESLIEAEHYRLAYLEE